VSDYPEELTRTICHPDPTSNAETVRPLMTVKASGATPYTDAEIKASVNGVDLRLGYEQAVELMPMLAEQVAWLAEQSGPVDDDDEQWSAGRALYEHARRAVREAAKIVDDDDETEAVPLPVTFTQEPDDEPFTATRRAEKFIGDRGWSVGSMQRDAPRAVIFGDDIAIAKWRNLSNYERAAADAYLTGGGLHGPLLLSTEYPEGS
jgi:hypothetical protein